MKSILVLCTGNSCRSQMAQGYLQHYAGNDAKVYSAGIEIHGVNAMAVEVMKEDGIDISHHTSNHVDEYAEHVFNIVITVCDNAHKTCPYFPGKVERFHQNFFDPTTMHGTPDEIKEEFRKVRNEIKLYAQDFV